MDNRKPLDSGDELESGAIKDKAAKIAYLDKLVALVGVCSGHEINARPSKIVAGLEPEGTNALLAVRDQTRTQAAVVIDRKERSSSGKRKKSPRKQSGDSGWSAVLHTGPGMQGNNSVCSFSKG